MGGMKYGFGAVLFVVVLSHAALALPPKGNDEAEIRTLEQSLVAAAKVKNSEKVMACYAPEQSPVRASPATDADHLLRRRTPRPRSRRRDSQNNFQQRNRGSFALQIILKLPRLSWDLDAWGADWQSNGIYTWGRSRLDGC